VEHKGEGGLATDTNMQQSTLVQREKRWTADSVCEHHYWSCFWHCKAVSL